MIDIEDKLERMYKAVSGGKRSGPNLEQMPQPLKDQQGRDRYIDVDGQLRRVFPSRPAIFLNGGQAAYATFSNTKPDPEFWGDLKERTNADLLDGYTNSNDCDHGYASAVQAHEG